MDGVARVDDTAAPACADDIRVRMRAQSKRILENAASDPGRGEEHACGSWQTRQRQCSRAQRSPKREGSRTKFSH